MSCTPESNPVRMPHGVVDWLENGTTAEAQAAAAALSLTGDLGIEVDR